MTGSSTKPIRAFIAVRPGDAVQAELVRVRRELKKKLSSSGLRIKWTDPETFHITLLFLGDIPEQGIAETLEKIRNPTQSVPSIGTLLNGLGLFKKSGALWVGIDAPPELLELQEALAVALDMEPGRFHAHFTLGRIKAGRAGHKVFHTLEKIEVEPVSFEIKAVELVQSELLSEGARHTVLGSAPLR